MTITYRDSSRTVRAALAGHIDEQLEGYVIADAGFVLVSATGCELRMTFVHSGLIHTRIAKKRGSWWTARDIVAPARAFAGQVSAMRG
ncbi:hypothetical protein CEG14_15000 [Bordetella genomosp. 1]|uniref:Uncharacterized protein n=1 Tax=Bordetella genomosp. 1 TaxID=1395607 RepID=A0A261SG11_9BORD|nr:hypothetical protein [Bordetella genomosp. 1]OZI36316.1 hypothetical protein CEG14_15000 [Bordetella genomosp. 1]